MDFPSRFVTVISLLSSYIYVAGYRIKSGMTGTWYVPYILWQILLCRNGGMEVFNCRSNRIQILSSDFCPLSSDLQFHTSRAAGHKDGRINRERNFIFSTYNTSVISIGRRMLNVGCWTFNFFSVRTRWSFTQAGPLARKTARLIEKETWLYSFRHKDTKFIINSLS